MSLAAVVVGAAVGFEARGPFRRVLHPQSSVRLGFFDGIPVAELDRVDYLSLMVSIVDSGHTELGGQSARWWDITVASARCGEERDFNPDAQCVTFLANELAFG